MTSKEGGMYKGRISYTMDVAKRVYDKVFSSIDVKLTRGLEAHPSHTEAPWEVHGEKSRQRSFNKAEPWAEMLCFD